MEPEGSLPSSQELSTCIYPEPDQSSPQHSLLSLKGPSCSTTAEKRMPSSGMLCRVALVRTDVSKELSASIFRVTRIGELEKTLAVTNN
jgi:hypothetical protein